MTATTNLNKSYITLFTMEKCIIISIYLHEKNKIIELYDPFTFILFTVILAFYFCLLFLGMALNKFI